MQKYAISKLIFEKFLSPHAMGVARASYLPYLEIKLTFECTA